MALEQAWGDWRLAGSVRGSAENVMRLAGLILRLTEGSLRQVGRVMQLVGRALIMDVITMRLAFRLVGIARRLVWWAARHAGMSLKLMA
jgi:hypothetical protein